MRARSWIMPGCALALGAAVSAAGCAGIRQGSGAPGYPTTRAGEAANVAARGKYAYVSRGAAGIEVLHLPSAGTTLLPLPPGPDGFDSADDLAVADDLLFVLDAQPPGHLAVFSLADPAAPRLASVPAKVEVAPFSGVAANGGRVVVSGGASPLGLRTYDAEGRLSGLLTTARFGRSHPDVTLCPYGEYAFVSVHDGSPGASLKVARLADTPPAVTLDSTVEFAADGLTPGGARPANFPLEAAIAGETLYVASAQGLSIFDLSTTTTPKLLARLPLPVQGVNVDVHRGIAAVVGSAPAPALVLVDVRDPGKPSVMQSFPLPEGSLATGVALTAYRAVVAAHARGALLLDRESGTWVTAAGGS